MNKVKVKWSNVDLKGEMSRLGIDTTQANINAIKENGLQIAMENAMTEAGWSAMEEVIRNTFPKGSDQDGI